MGVFDRFKRAPPQELIVVPKATLSFGGTSKNDGQIRLGMWVTTPESRVGIVTKIENTNVEVTHTKGDGSTLMVLNSDDQAVPSVVTYPVNQLSQAKRNELPSRVQLDDVTLTAMGYV